MPLQPEPSLTPAPPQPTAVPSAALTGPTPSEQEEALHESLLGLINYKKARESGFDNEAIFAEAKKRLQKQEGLFRGQINPYEGISAGFTYRQLLEENDRRMRKNGKATIDMAEPKGMIRRGASAAYDFFVPEDPTEKMPATAGQLATAPLRMLTEGADMAGSAVASNLPRLAPNSEALQLLSAGLGTAASVGLDPMNWNPRAALKATQGGIEAVQAVKGAAELGKPTMGALGRLANTPVPGKAGQLLDRLAGQAEAGGVFSVFDPRDVAASGKDLAELGGAGARGVQRLWEGRAGGMGQADILADVAKAQENRQLEPRSIDDLNKYTVREQLARDVSEAAGRVGHNEFRPAFYDELKAIRADPANSDETLKAAGKARLNVQAEAPAAPRLSEQQDVWYHGTPTAGFDEFEKGNAVARRGEGLYGPGTYITNDPSIASSYASKRVKVPYGEKVPQTGAPGVYPVKADVSNPLDVRSPGDALMRELESNPSTAAYTNWGKVKEHLPPGYTADDVIRAMREDYHAANDTSSGDMLEIQGLLQDLGYDAVKYPGGKNTGGKAHEAMVVFGKGEVKSAIFDKSKPHTKLPGVLSPEQMEEIGAAPAQIKLEPPDKSPAAKPYSGGLRGPDPAVDQVLRKQQAEKLNPEGRVAMSNLDQDQEMSALLQDPVQAEKTAAEILKLPEHNEFPSWARPIPKEAPYNAGLFERLKVGAGNLTANAGYAMKAPVRVPWGVFKQYFADPSATLPRLAAETGRAYEKMAHTRGLFLEHTNRAIKALGKDERLAVAAMLDSKPEEWASNGELAKFLQGPAKEKVLAGYRDLRKMLNKLAEVEGLEPHQRVTDYFPHISSEDYIRKNPQGMAVPDLGIYAKAIENRFHTPREGMTNYSMDLADVLNVRISTGLRKAYINPVVTAFEPRFVELPRHMQDYADLYVRRLQGRPGPWHEVLDTTIRRLTANSYNVGDLTRGQVFFTMMYYRGLLGGAFDTAFKNLSQVQNTFAELGVSGTLRGAKGLLSGRGREVMERAGVGADYERIIEASGNLHSSFWNMADKALFMPMRFSEYINRGVAFHGGLIKAYDLGLTGNQAVNYAKHVVDKTQFRYGVTNTSPYLQNPLGKLFYQFGSYPVKELQFMEEVLKDKDKSKLTRMLLLHGFVYGAAKATGSTFNEAFGQEEWTVPLTGNKRLGKKPLTVDLPTAMATHFLNFTAPVPKLAGTAAGAVLELKDGKYTGRNVKGAIDQATNMIPAARYGKKLYDLYEKIDQGFEKGKQSGQVRTYGVGAAAAEAIGARRALK